MTKTQIFRYFCRKSRNSKNIYGTCAGAIIMSNCTDDKMKTLKCINIKSYRNFWGRQINSFTDNINLKFSKNSYKAHFIRAPRFVCQESTLQILTKMIDSSDDKCFSCREKGHFIRDCPYSSDDEFSSDDFSSEEEDWECEYCDKEFNTEKGCLIHENKYCKENPFLTRKAKKISCYRCGREGHYASSCYASKHINGNKLFT